MKEAADFEVYSRVVRSQMKRSGTPEWMSQEARERLHPSITNPNWLVLRARREIFANWISILPERGLRILDVGGRIQPYRPLFESRVGKYISLDRIATSAVNVVGLAEYLPFEAGQFDVVLCTQVLEYVPHPQDVLDEIYRVLRPGGFLFLSSPAVFPRDSDPEYWRFLPSSLQLLLRMFSEIEIAPEGSTISGLFRTLNVSLAAFAPSMLKPVLRYTAIPLINVVGVLGENLARTKNDQFTANFSALARK